MRGGRDRRRGKVCEVGSFREKREDRMGRCVWGGKMRRSEK